jgi:hypothetical protein
VDRYKFIVASSYICHFRISTADSNPGPNTINLNMDGPVNPRSPLDLKPDPEVLMSHSMHHYSQGGGSMMQPPSPELMAGGSMVRISKKSKPTDSRKKTNS